MTTLSTCLEVAMHGTASLGLVQLVKADSPFRPKVLAFI